MGMGMMFFGFLAILVIGLVVSSLILMLAAKLAGVRERSLGKCMGVVVLSTITSFLAGVVLNLFGLIGALMSIMASFAIFVALIHAMMQAEWTQAFVTAIINYAIVIGGGLLIALTLGVMSVVLLHVFG